MGGDDDLGLPKSSLQKAIKDMLPGDMRIAGDASDLLVQCCNQFVHLVSTQANVVSEREKRSTISPEHVVRSLEELEFGGRYVEAVKEVWEEWKVDNKEHHQQKLAHRKSGTAQGTGLTQEQLIELQHRLFEEARAATLSGPLPSLSLEGMGLEAAVVVVAGGDAAAAASPGQQQQQQQQQQHPGVQAGMVAAEPAALQHAGDGAAAEQQQAAPGDAVVESGDAAGEDDDALDDVSDVDSEVLE